VRLLDFNAMGRDHSQLKSKRMIRRTGICFLLLFIPRFFAVHGQANGQMNPAAPATVITLEQAIALALKNDPAYAASVASSRSIRLDRAISRSLLLPNAIYHNQYLYTQPNGVINQGGQIGLQAAPKFIANNAIREYASELLVTQTISATGIYDYKRTGALASKASADLEISRRDLVLRVVTGYFNLAAADNKLHVAERGAAEAQAFLDLTMKLEAGREVAHADVVKASLQSQQRQREANDAKLAANRARLDLGTVLFPDPRTDYQIAENPPPALPARTDVDTAAARLNPDLLSALQQVKAAQAGVLAARSAYLPTLSLNWTYGIDAPQFAVNGPRIESGTSIKKVRNLGYSTFVNLDFPVWDWFATHNRVKQSQYQEQAAQVALTYVQRQLIAQLENFYSEAKVANGQLASLEESAQTAAESLRLTKLKYAAGEATALEVVDAQTALTMAEAARADGALRYRVALANLQTLTGTL
jgi:outer membrane protein